MISLRRGAVLLTLSATVACQKGEKKAEPGNAPVMPSFSDKAAGAPAENKPPADPGAMPAPGEDPIVRLLAPGAEPRKALRFRMKAGDKQRVAMRMKMDMEMNLPGNSQKMDMPTMVMVLDVTATSVAPNGDIGYEFVMSEVSVSDDGQAQLKAALEGMLSSASGMTGKGVISNRGFNKGAEISLPPNANPQLAQTMGQMKDTIAQMAAPVPEEPVGVGGKWEVRTAIKQQGIVVKQTGTYEITSLDGDRVGTKTTVTQSADSQPMVNEQVPALKMELTRMVGGGSGDLVFDLTKGLPARAHAEIGNELDMVVDSGGEKQNIGMKMKVDVKIDES